MASVKTSEPIIHRLPEETVKTSSGRDLAPSSHPRMGNTDSSADDLLHQVIKDPKKRNMCIGGVNAALHFCAAATNFIEDKGPVGAAIFKTFDRLGFFFTKFLAPYLSYGSAAVEAILGKRSIEAGIKTIPPLLLPFVGDANVDVVYGLTSCLNCWYDEASNKMNDTEKQVAKKSYAKNAQQVLKSIGKLWKDYFSSSKKDNLWFLLTSSLFIVAGGVPILAFARKARDTVFARTMGAIRFIGAIGTDIAFMTSKGEGKNYKRLISAFCSSGAVAGVLKRWTSEKLSRTFVHLDSALSVAGYAVWNAFNATRKTATKTS